MQTTIVKKLPKKIITALKKYTEAVIDESLTGARAPEDAHYYEKALEQAKIHLCLTILGEINENPTTKKLR